MQLAVFDLDGTITRHDTLVPYVFGFLMRNPRRFLRLPRVVPAIVSFALRRSDRGALKGALLHGTLGGVTRAQLDAWTERFVKSLLTHGVFNDALETIRSHRGEGDVLVLMSASPDLYVPVIARQLGFTEVACTGIRWNGDRLDGWLATPNCRGVEKVRRFEELRRRHAGTATVAYGNAASDLEHLKLADRGVLVNGSEAARRHAARTGVNRADWR